MGQWVVSVLGHPNRPDGLKLLHRHLTPRGTECVLLSEIGRESRGVVPGAGLSALGLVDDGEASGLCEHPPGGVDVRQPGGQSGRRQTFGQRLVELQAS